MRRVGLGGSDLKVSEFALGTMNFGKDTDTAQSLDLVEAYVAAGGNLLDTADCYGDGNAEEICGLALRRHGEALLVATKTGRPIGDGDADSGYAPARVRARVEDSLRRLRVERIDLYQLHQWDPGTRTGDAVETLVDLQRQGKIRSYGVSNLPSWALGEAHGWAAALGWPPMTACQYHYSLSCRDIEADIVPFLHANGIGLMSWSPLGGGVLTGRYRRPERLRRRGDRPAGKRGYGYERAQAAAAQVVDAVVDVAAECGVPPGAVALRWLLDQPVVATAIVGCRTTAQLAEDLAAVSLRLTAEQRATLDRVSSPAPGYPYDFLATVVPTSAGPRR